MPRHAALLASVILISACNSTSPDASMTLPSGTHQSVLTPADGGAGIGGVSVTPNAVAGGYFDATIKVRLARALPNTTYFIQRAPEIGRTLASDGICQRALGLAPWSPADPPAPAFITFMSPGTTTPISLTTSATGDASVDFNFQAPMIPAGTRFDVMFRLVKDLSAPTSAYLSGCFTVTVL